MKTYQTYLLWLFIMVTFVPNLFGQRDPYKWPFAKTSIWNMPIHNSAQYTHAKIGIPTSAGLKVDEDYIVLTPNAPLTPTYYNSAGWTSGKDRCISEGALLFNAPIPASFVINKSNWLGNTPNSGLAVLMPDGETIKQTQPFARCTAGGDAASKYAFADQNIYGDGILGAHGGSGMSAIGGTIRLGELVPGGVIRHAFKINIFASKYLYYDAATGGKRWPAPVADGYAKDVYGKTGTPEFECRMGALLALKPDLDLTSLNFETGNDGPAMILAKAFQNYGAYIVDDPYWDIVAIPTEFSPEGRVIDEFKNAWGYPLETGTNTPLGRDMAKIITRLHVITNNTASTIGGGSTSDLINRRAEAACDFGTPGSGLMCSAGSSVPVSSVSVDLASASILEGSTKQILATVLPADATNKSLHWTSSNSGVATVSSSGLVTGVGAGTATITATSHDGGKTATSNITVTGGGTSTTYQAESFSSQSGCSTSTSFAGYTGSSFVDFGGNGSYIEWNNVSAASAGSFTLTFWYANGSASNRSCSISVNGASVGTLDFAPYTTVWSNWTSVSITASLKAGNNIIRLAANSSNGGPNVDKMVVAIEGATTNISANELPEKRAIVVYPNPTDGNVNIQLSGNASSNTVTIFNAEGKLVASHDFKETNQISFNPGLNAGVFLLKVDNKNGNYFYKLIVR